jgi:hypothetical protein
MRPDPGVDSRDRDPSTGTQANGDADSANCNGWTWRNGVGSYGVLTVDKPGWTASDVEPCDGCAFEPTPSRNLYCFEID